MHILFLTDNFPPEVNAPASRTFEHCREWVQQDHQVTVITCAPNFPKGEVFPGYRNRAWQSEMVEGIKVIRVWSYISANEGFLRRTLDYMSYMASATLAAPFVRNVDVVVGTSPQFFTACAAWVSAALKRKPFVFEVRDLWPDSIKAVGAVGSEGILNALEKLELFLYRRATAVITVTHAFKRNITERGIDAEKISVVTNGVDQSRFSVREKDPELLQALGLEGKLVAGYVGTHGMAHALDTLLDAAETLKAHPDGKNTQLLLLGDGAEKQKLAQAAEARGLDNVTLLDTVPKEDVARYWSLLDVSIVHLRRTELFKTVIPSKLFECMAMGLPVLHGVEGESAQIVEKHRIGLPFQPENSVELTNKLLKLNQNRELRKELRANCLNAAPLYDRTRLAREMLATLGQCVELCAKEAGDNASIERGRRATKFHEGRAHR